jgi:hypothetical protein
MSATHTTAPTTRYACCFAALDRSGEAHVQFATVQAHSHHEVLKTLANEYALVSVISALELDEDES